MSWRDGKSAKACREPIFCADKRIGRDSGKIVTGMMALKRKDSNEAIRQITDANNLLDTWIGHFDLGQVYLAAGAFTEADSQFDQCMKRRGETH